jgi:hypothetical protein
MEIRVREFVKNNIPILIGRRPILNDITLSGFSFNLAVKVNFFKTYQNNSPERASSFRIG